jgi:hypothetical protein
MAYKVSKYSCKNTDDDKTDDEAVCEPYIPPKYTLSQQVIFEIRLYLRDKNIDSTQTEPILQLLSEVRAEGNKFGSDVSNEMHIHFDPKFQMTTYEKKITLIKVIINNKDLFDFDTDQFLKYMD